MKDKSKYSKRGKEIEENIPESSLNEADLPSTNKRSNRSNKNTNNSNSKSGNKRSRSRKNNSYDDGKSRPNDPGFYNKLRGLVATSVEVQNMYPLGMPVMYGGSDGVVNTYNTVPGIMTLYYAPTMGYSKDVTSPANLAIGKLYSYMQATVSVNFSFDPADVGLYIMAWDSMFQWYTLLVKVYAALLMTNPMNAYEPRVIVEQLGFDYTSLKHSADFAFFLNNLAQTLNRYNVPAGFDVISRHLQLVSGLYTDADKDIKAQFYQFRPSWLYIYDEKSPSTPGQLIPYNFYTVATDNQLLNFEDIQTITDTILLPIIQSQDFWNISSYMIRAFGETNMMRVQGVSMGMVLVPTYRPEILQQINNCTVFPTPDLTNDTINQSWSIRQGELDSNEKEGAIIQTPRWFFPQLTVGSYTGVDYTIWPYLRNRLLNVMDSNYSADNMLEVSRLMVIPSAIEADTGSDRYLEINACGTEIILGVAMAQYIPVVQTNPNGKYQVFTNYIPRTYMELTTVQQSWTYIESAATASAFDWNPTTYGFRYDSTASHDIVFPAMTEIRDYTVVTYEMLYKLHTAAVTSQFLNPMVDKFAANPYNRK